MTPLNNETKAYIQEFYKANETFFGKLVANYGTLVKTLSSELDVEDVDQLTFDSLIGITNAGTKEAMIEIGYHFYDLKKALRRKTYAEFLIDDKGMDVTFLSTCEQVHHYLEIKDRIINIDNLLNPIKKYKQGKLDEEGMRQLYAHISSYQNNFNKHHLKKYALRLFGMPYKELIQIKEDCFEQTYNSYATINISKEGTVYTKKDGTQSR